MKKIFEYPYWGRMRGAFYAGLCSKAIIFKPLIITPCCIKFGFSICIQKNCRIQGISLYEGVTFRPQIIISNGVSIQQNLHLTCAGKIEIGSNTAIAANVTITDINHPYQDIELPIEKQHITVESVKIGEDCKIYNNAVILAGTRIGKHCVVGANSVVSGEYPDYSIIVGIPARIIKKYNIVTEKWEQV